MTPPQSAEPRVRRAFWILILAAVVAGGALRLASLAARPMHADEAVQADKFGTLLEHGTYRYDPGEHHGPALPYLSLIPAWLSGARSYPELSETTLRLLPAIFGLLMVLLPLLAGDGLGWRAAGWAAWIAAVSPAMVYYSRYYIPETLLAFFTAATLVCGYRWGHSRRSVWAAAAGFSAGMMYAAKETSVIAFAAMAAAGLLCGRARLKKLHAGAAAAAFVVTAAVLFSSFGQNPAGLVDSIRSCFTAYWGRAFEAGPHIHPWHYYLGLLVWFRADGGPVFTEAAVLLLAAAGGYAAWREKSGFSRFLAVSALIMAAVYSIVPYKTPWCLLSFHSVLVLVAGRGAAWLVTAAPAGAWRGFATAVLCLAGGHLLWQARQAAFTYPADPRNPWVYAHTGPDVFPLRDRIAALAAASPSGREVPVQVFTTANLWPLPWYLRSYPNVRWWNGVPAGNPAAPLILATPDMEAAIARMLYEDPPPGQRELFLDLFDRRLEIRPGVEVRGYVAKSLWDRLVQGK
jgi:uncharacterized protein (TIGR03663 family)